MKFGVSYEDRTHTPSATNLCADHYTKDTITLARLGGFEPPTFSFVD